MQEQNSGEERLSHKVGRTNAYLKFVLWTVNGIYTATEGKEISGEMKNAVFGLSGRVWNDLQNFALSKLMQEM